MVSFIKRERDKFNAMKKYVTFVYLMQINKQAVIYIKTIYNMINHSKENSDNVKIRRTSNHKQRDTE